MFSFTSVRNNFKGKENGIISFVCGGIGVIVNTLFFYLKTKGSIEQFDSVSEKNQCMNLAEETLIFSSLNIMSFSVIAYFFYKYIFETAIVSIKDEHFKMIQTNRATSLNTTRVLNEYIFRLRIFLNTFIKSENSNTIKEDDAVFILVALRFLTRLISLLSELKAIHVDVGKILFVNENVFVSSRLNKIRNFFVRGLGLTGIKVIWKDSTDDEFKLNTYAVPKEALEMIFACFFMYFHPDGTVNINIFNVPLHNSSQNQYLNIEVIDRDLCGRNGHFDNMKPALESMCNSLDWKFVYVHYKELSYDYFLFSIPLYGTVNMNDENSAIIDIPKEDGSIDTTYDEYFINKIGGVPVVIMVTDVLINLTLIGIFRSIFNKFVRVRICETYSDVLNIIHSHRNDIILITEPNFPYNFEYLKGVLLICDLNYNKFHPKGNIAKVKKESICIESFKKSLEEILNNI